MEKRLNRHYIVFASSFPRRIKRVQERAEVAIIFRDSDFSVARFGWLFLRRRSESPLRDS